MKFKWSLLMLLLGVMLFVVACGGADAPADEPAEEETAAEEAEEAMEEEAEEAMDEEAMDEEMEEEAMEEEAMADGDCSSEEVFCIGLVTDVGKVDDKSFNQSAWEGAQLAGENLGAKVDFIETSDATDYAENIGLFVGEGYDVIVTVGFALGEATAIAATENPDIDFIGVDQFQVEEMSNLTGLIFPEAKAGFLAGALAAMMSESGTIAAVLGTDLVPPVVNFKEGYEAGAQALNADINLISTYHPGGLDTAFTDPEWGATTAAQAIDQGADVIFGAGGNTGNGALIEVASNDGLLCIGVDTDQWGTLPQAHPCLISSAMKLITPGVADLAALSQDGAFPGGNFVGEVGLAPFHDFDGMVPDGVKATLEMIDAGLADGSIDPLSTDVIEMMGGDMMEDEAMAEEPAMVEGDCSEEAVFCIGLVTDVGKVDDKSFNQSAWEGAQQAGADLGAKVDFIETSDATDYAENIGLFISEGYDVIVTVGFALGEATAIAASENPDVYFIGVDQFQVEAMPNVAGLIFPEDKAGYLAGALAAMMSESGTIAAVLGTDLVPPVVAFKEGYEAGAVATNPDINLISTYHPGGLDTAFTDPEWGATTAAQAIDQGADVIFGAGGNTGNGALIEVASNDGLFCIGVDTDQWGTLPQAHPCLISSAMKLIAPGVADLAAMAKDGEFPSGNFVGEVGLAPFHDFSDTIPADVQEKLEELDAGLKDGSISTGYGQ